MQARAREIKEEYAIETMIDRHLELYESLLQAATARRSGHPVQRGDD